MRCAAKQHMAAMRSSQSHLRKALRYSSNASNWRNILKSRSSFATFIALAARPSLAALLIFMFCAGCTSSVGSISESGKPGKELNRSSRKKPFT